LRKEKQEEERGEKEGNCFARRGIQREQYDLVPWEGAASFVKN